MMLNRRQSQLAPLTEENLKKHRTETIPRQTSSKRFIERQTSLRSVGDGQSVELQYDEHILKSSAGDQKKDDDQGIDYFDLILPNNTSANVTLGEMNVKSDKNYSLKTSTEWNDGLKMNDNTREDQSIEQQKGNEPSTEETLKFDFDFNGEIAGQLEKKEKEDSDDAENSDEDSDFSSPVDTDSDVTYDNNKKLQNVNSSAASADSSCSSSPLVDETDDEDDDDDDDDETEEDDERENSWAKSEDELSHYTSSLNASVSSIPTLYDDRESPETPSSPDESPNYNENQAENGELRNGHEEEIYDKEKYIENRLNEEVILKENDQNKMETLSNCSDGNLSPLQSRQVCGRSASPLTVVMSEFDDVESTIFDHREASSLDSSSRNKFTSLDSNEGSEVSIKNWVGLKEDSVTNRADSEQCGSPVHKDIKIKGNKRKIKTRKELNAKKTHLIKIVKKNIPTTKVLKYHNLSKTNPKKSDQVDFQKEMVKGQISMSDDSDGVNEEQNINRMARRKLKRPSKKRVSFEDSKTAENISKMGLNDSAVFGRRTESRDNEEEASPRPPESENSGRGSSHWSAVESDLSAGSGTKPASTVYSPRSFFSSRQTTLVDKMTTRNALLESVSLEQRRINLAAVRKRGK